MDKRTLESYIHSAEGLAGILYKAPNNLTFYKDKVYCLSRVHRHNSLCSFTLTEKQINVELESLETTKMTKEEELLRERQRMLATGITSYSLDRTNEIILLPAGTSLYIFDIQTKEVFLATPPADPQAKMDSKVSPAAASKEDLIVSYVAGGDIYVQQLYGQKTNKRLTFASQKPRNTAGVAEYIMQEEFSRFTGYWWCPAKTQSGKHRIAYFEVDESEVPNVKIPVSGSLSADVDEFVYPRAGEKNAKSTLCVVDFDPQLQEEPVITRFDKLLTQDLPWVEYVARAGWTPDGKKIWMRLLDRKQQRYALIAFDPETSSYEIIHEEKTKYWINITDTLQFLKDGRVLLTSEELGQGFNHLFLFERDGNAYKCAKQLTQGQWQISGNDLFVDETNQIAYFCGTKDTPLENHLYAVSYASGSDGSVIRVSQSGFTHSSIVANENLTSFICTNSNISTKPAVKLFSKKQNSMEFDCTEIISFAEHPVSALFPLTTPQLFNFTNKHGDIIYGCILRPPNYDQEKKYPCYLHIYGGPHVQLVTNRYGLSVSGRLQLLASLGFIVVMFDGRGSANRGIDFEGHLRERMGQFEIEDSIEGIEHLISLQQTSGAPTVPANIDRSRIAISGWSYGGYLSVMGIAQRPDFFKVGIAGAPVTMWELYDTGYTERYMDTPQNNPEGYKLGSCLHYAPNIPDEEDRLLLIHGLSDENVHFKNTEILIKQLVSLQKPYQLLIYPGERHGVRSAEAIVHHQYQIIRFLLNHL